MTRGHTPIKRPPLYPGQISSQADFNPDHLRFARQLHRVEAIETTNDRIGGKVLSAVMTFVAVFIVAGIAFGWFA